MRKRILWVYHVLFRADILLLLGVLLVIGGTYAFLHVLEEVNEGETQAFDRWAIDAVEHLPHFPALEQMGADITALGGVAVLTLVSCAVAGHLLLSHKYAALLLLIVAVGGGTALTFALKGQIDRDRPDVSLHKTYVSTKSFPSGHAMLSAVVYLTLGTLLARLTKERRLKFYYISLAILLSGLIGLSRVYLRVHWPTDVLAGWSAGLVWAIGCWAVARWLQHRGKVEQPR
ncbi:MAG TPA: phosphatase PAP2 family protein [Tepidisphaeraceae bacterium]|jgi:undecaprenyl-diphosphatase